MQCTINTSVCVCSSHLVTGDLMLITVERTWKKPVEATERTCNITYHKFFSCILINIFLIFDSCNYSYLLHVDTTLIQKQNVIHFLMSTASAAMIC